jgi:hypothetical protein
MGGADRPRPSAGCRAAELCGLGDGLIESVSRRQPDAKAPEGHTQIVHGLRRSMPCA